VVNLSHWGVSTTVSNYYGYNLSYWWSGSCRAVGSCWARQPARTFFRRACRCDDARPPGVDARLLSSSVWFSGIARRRCVQNSRFG